MTRGKKKSTTNVIIFTGLPLFFNVMAKEPLL
jgi:hypothetical protein